MKFLSALTKLFLLPGTIMLSHLNVSVEQDGGVFRSLFNMIFWGFIGVMIVLPLMVAKHS
ncbi:MAG: hypothetical protein ACPGVT_13935 [Maricaulaceae bacterium]